MRITYHYRSGVYITLINGVVEEAHTSLVGFLESLDGLAERWENRIR